MNEDRLQGFIIIWLEENERMDKMIKKESMRILNNKLHKMSLDKKDEFLRELIVTD